MAVEFGIISKEANKSIIPVIRVYSFVVSCSLIYCNSVKS